MAKYTVPGALLTLLGIVWILQGTVGKAISGGMNGQPIWAVIGLVAVVCGVALIGFGRRSRSREPLE